MGWLYMQRPAGGAKAYLDKQLTWETEGGTSKLLRSATYGMFEYYAAVEQIEKATGKRTVFAVAVMMRYTRDGDWGYKDMGEEMGPNIDNCPASILDLLTPTGYEHAIEWRARCRDKAAMTKLSPGTVVRYGGHEYRLDRPNRGGSWQVTRLSDAYGFRMKPGQLRQAGVVQEVLRGPT